MLVVLLGVVVLGGCRKKVSQPQCDAMLDHYAELVARESAPDASAEVIKAEQARERGEARGDDDFKNCTSEIEPADYDCAMKADTADAVEKCLQ